MGFPYFLPSVIDASSYALPACRAAFLPDSLADFPSPYLFAVRPDFLPSVPPSGNNPLGTVPATPSQFAMFLPADRTPTHIASSHRIVRLRPHRLSVHAACPSRYCGGSIVLSHGSAKWRGGESMACQIGANRRGFRWRPTDMPDAIHDARSRRSSWQRIPDTDMEAREAGEMLYACRTTISCDTEHAGISHFQPKLPSVRFRPVRSGSYHMLGMGMALPRVLESWSGHRPWRLGAFLLIAGRRGGRGENRMSLEDTWHVAR